MDSNLAIVLATIVTQLTIRQLGLDQSLYGVLYNGIQGVILGFEMKALYDLDTYNFITLNKILLCILLFIMSFYL